MTPPFKAAKKGLDPNMLELSAVFIGVFVLNAMPVLAPPTWLVLSMVVFNLQDLSPFTLALVAAVAATAGRAALAKASRSITGSRFIGAHGRENIEMLRQVFVSRRNWTRGGMLVYAFTPLPTNYLFIAYGLTGLPLHVMALPFFIGRLCTYFAWALAARAAAMQFAPQINAAGDHFAAYFVISQVLLLLVAYLLTRIDWRALIAERKLRWFK